MSLIDQVVDGLVTRICVGLPTTCASMDDQAASAMFDHLSAVHAVVVTLENQAHRQMWLQVLAKLTDQKKLHGLIAGRACRLLLDMAYFKPAEAARRLGQALPSQRLATKSLEELLQAAFWLEGFLKGSGLLLVHDQTLFVANEAGQIERNRRWRLILGQGDEGQNGESGQGSGQPQPGSGAGDAAEAEGQAAGDLSEQDQSLEQALDGLYGDQGGLGPSAPDIARWLGDIRRYFPGPVAQLVQQDALKKLNLRHLLTQPELLAEIEPDLELAARLLALGRIMSTETRETAQAVVRQVVEELTQKLEHPWPSTSKISGNGPRLTIL